MGNLNKNIDAYIERSADFAKPILTHFRDLVHRACPDVEEKIKWSMPFFDYMGEMMCNMAAFKQHAVVGFWKAALMKDEKLISHARSEISMGHLGKITCLKDLPPDKQLIAYINEAMKLNENGIKLPTKQVNREKKELVIPDYFTKALKKNKPAARVFTDFSYSHKKEYLEWITEAKTEPTRNKRMETAIEMMVEGKTRNWKYAAKK